MKPGVGKTLPFLRLWNILLTEKGMHIKKAAVDKEWTWNLSSVLFLAALVLARTMQCPGLHVP